MTTGIVATSDASCSPADPFSNEQFSSKHRPSLETGRCYQINRFASQWENICIWAINYTPPARTL